MALNEDRYDSLADAMPCPTCGRSLPTRVLADAVTLITVGVCPEDGTQELSRVSFGAETTEPARRDDADLVSVRASSAYKPGTPCGRRLDEHTWCRLPRDHREPHTA